MSHLGRHQRTNPLSLRFLIYRTGAMSTCLVGTESRRDELHTRCPPRDWRTVGPLLPSSLQSTLTPHRFPVGRFTDLQKWYLSGHLQKGLV